VKAAQELARKYAMAVFSHALEGWLSALGAVQEKMAKNVDLATDLANGDRSFADRQKDLDGIIPAETDQSIRNFLYALLKDGHIDSLADILMSLGQIASGGPLAQVGQVTSAIALTDDEKDKFRQKLQAQYGADLELAFNVDSTILGGAIVQVGDKVLDGSVATRLEAMKNALGVKV
jgi:F-type H+-transporting ATPase subunit delta